MSNRVKDKGKDDVSAQLKSKLDDVKEDLGEIAKIMSTASADTIAEAGHAAKDAVSAGRDKARQWEGSFEDEIRDHPIRSVLVAGGLGILAGMLWRR